MTEADTARRASIYGKHDVEAVRRDPRLRITESPEFYQSRVTCAPKNVGKSTGKPMTTLDMLTGIVYPSASQAAFAAGMSVARVVYHCHNEVRRPRFRFVTDEEIVERINARTEKENT